MQPKELNELAAKALGLNYCHASGFACRPNGEPPFPWNPWENNGDAFAASVELGIIHHSGEGMAEAVRLVQKELRCILSLADNDNDPVKATRRAIVHVAAKVGAELNGDIG